MKKVLHRRFLSIFLLLCFLASSSSQFDFTPKEIGDSSTENLILKKESHDFTATIFIEQEGLEILTDDRLTNLFPFNNSKINQRNSGFLSQYLAKTELQASKSGTLIVPSLDTTTLIYPFHSFL